MPRLFFALWPDDATRRALARAARECAPARARAVPERNLHITLAFAGQVDTATAAALERGAGRIRGTAFGLRIDRCGFWKRSGIAWIGPARTPAALGDLVAALNGLFAECGLAPEHRKYRAHLTVARRLDGPGRRGRIEPISWEINEFSLVESVPSEQGSTYKVLGSWSLSSA